MIYKFQSQSAIINPVELAEKKLKAHKESGSNSSLSIFEVANLMDTLFFSNQSISSNSNTFEICFN